jgi:S-(hydroxymethyl)glutathione dehydrogenase / alcohol dehydrogenase
VTARDRARAAVLNEVGRLDLEDVFVDRPSSGELRVRPAYVGVCHSDLHYIDGTHTTELPEILGHEAAGIVEAVGPGVTGVQVGDHVVTSLTMFCGRCRACVTGRISLCRQRAVLRHRPRPAVVNGRGEAVGTMGGVGAFAELVLVRETGVVKVPGGLPLDLACLFGCAVLTGVGAVTRSAQVPVGATVAVIGCGGIGLAAVQGARLAGASRIVAIDRDPQKLRVAGSMGATDTLEAGDHVKDRVLDLVPGGVDFSFEAVGRRETAELALGLLVPGGLCTVLGMVPDSTPIRVPASELYFHEKRLSGAFIGSSRFTVDVPQLAALHEQGRLQLAELITHRLPLQEVNQGFDLLARGEALRVVLELGSSPP